MIASLKIKEENEERQRRVDNVVHLPNPNLTIIQASQIKTEGKFAYHNSHNFLHLYLIFFSIKSRWS